MALTKTQVSELYVSIFGRASEGEGNTYWQSGTDMETVAEQMLATDAANDYFGGTLDDQAFVEYIYLNTLNKKATDDADGITYWVGKLEDGESRGKVVADLVSAVESYKDATDPATKAAYDQFMNRVEVSNFTAEKIQKAPDDLTVLTFKTADGKGALDVTDSRDTVDEAILEIAALASTATEATEATETTGDILSLTVTADNIKGTDGNDTIYADIQQNAEGAIANALSTGDVINGEAGSDTLKATMMNDTVTNGANDEAFIPMPRMNSVETIEVEALGSKAVTIDAGKMVGTNNYTSFESRQALTFDDIRIEDKQITSDLTFRLDGTDGRVADTFTAQLDSESFRASTATHINSQMRVDLMDLGTEENPYDDAAPLGQLNVNGIKFTIDGVAKEIKSDAIDAAKTYAELKDAIQAALAEAAKTDDSIAGLTVSLKEDNFTTTGFGNHKGDSIIITDANGRTLEGTGFVQDGETSEFTLYGRFVEQDPTQVDSLITTNLELDNAGRNSTTGLVTIQGMSNSNEGVQVINVKVDEDSAIAGLETNLDYNGVNHGLQKIVITSLDQKGDLEIGALNDNIVTVDASAFEGSNLMLGSTKEVGNTADHNIANLTTLKANIGANVTFDGAITENAQRDTDTAYAYTTGSGADKVSVLLDGDAVDADGESFTLNTNSGNDTLTLTGDTTAGVSQNTMSILNNLKMNSGAGDDSITLDSYQNFNINAGSGSDFVRIESDGVNGNGTHTSTTVGNATGNQAWGNAGRVLVDAKLTLNFAGIEQTVKVKTDAAHNFIATQETINDAIIDAIAASPELSHLLKASLVTGTEQLKIEALVAGENDLSIDLFQPQLISAGTPTAAQTLITSSDVSALRVGLLATETVAGLSADLENAAEIVAWTDASADFYGSIGANGAGNKDLTIEFSGNKGDETVADLNADGAYQYVNQVQLGTDATVDVNFSTINLGEGDHDLVVLHSNDLSMNTIVIDGSFGKDTVINFFDSAPTDADTAHANVGLHMLDFSAILTNQTDTSRKVDGTDNADSAKAITVSLHDDDNTYVDGTALDDNIATANSVNVLHYNENAAKSVSFDAFTAEQLKATLNDHDNSYTTVVGGLDENSLTIKEYGDNLVGTTQNHIFMVENEANLGEYKVFSATSTLDPTDKTKLVNSDADDFTTVSELGVLDFGHSVNFNIKGDANSVTILHDLIASVDTGSTVVVDGVSTVVTTEVGATVDPDTSVPSTPDTTPDTTPDDTTPGDTTEEVAISGSATTTADDAIAEHFNIDTSATIAHTIADFDPANDTLDFGEGITSDDISIVNNADDGEAQLSYTPDGGTTVIDITLTGLTSAEDLDLTTATGVDAILA